MTNCKIKAILTPDGFPREDGRYPQRVGSIVRLNDNLLVGYPIAWTYIKDAEGNDKLGQITTSPIERVRIVGEYAKSGNEIEITVYTRNSIYVFEPVA